MAHAFPRTTPEEVGIPSSAIDRFLKEIDAQTIPMHSFMLLRHGKVCAEGWWKPYTADMQHIIYSCSKSFTSVAIGMCVQEGRLSLDDKVVDFFPDKLGEASSHPYIASRTIRNLLMMSTGNSYAIDRTAPDWIRTFLNTPPAVRPGALFGYDSSGTHTLSGIVQRVTGQNLMQYLKPRLLDPLGIEGAWCEMSPMGICVGHRGIHCLTEDMARFGQFLLQRGMWEGKQLLDPAYIEAATSRQIATATKNTKLDSNVGYGYQFWRLRNNAFACIGTGAQLIVVLPDEDIVFVTTGNALQGDADYEEFPEVIHLFWNQIYPWISKESLPADKAAHDALSAHCEALELYLPAGTDSSPLESSISGSRYVFGENKDGIRSIRLDFAPETLRLTVQLPEYDWVIDAGRHDWRAQHLAPAPDEGWARFVWSDEKTLICEANCRWRCGTYHFVLHFDEDSLSAQIRPSGWSHFGRLNLRMTGEKAN